MSQPIVVLGMHRSGTSALAGSLAARGVHFGSRLMDPMEGVNDKGFWEHTEIVAIHDEFLCACGSRWDDVREHRPEVWCSEAAGRATRRLADWVAKDLLLAPMWAVKDPRMCRLLPLWGDLWGEWDVEPVFVMTNRHPIEVAASLANRPSLHPPMGREKAALLYVLHVLESELHTRGRVRVATTYDDLLRNPDGTVDGIFRDLGLPLREESLFGEGRFVDDQLRHQRVETDQAADSHSHWAVSMALELWELSCSPGSLDSARSEDWDAFRRRLGERLETYDVALCQHIEDLEADLKRVRSWALEVHAAAAEREAVVTGEREAATEARRDADDARRERDDARRDCEAARRAHVDQQRYALHLAGENERLVGEVEGIRGSLSWRVTSPLRYAAGRLWHKSASPDSIAEPVPPAPSVDSKSGEGGGMRDASSTVYFTICSKNFLAYARALYKSLNQNHPGVHFVVALCDRLDGLVDLEKEPFEIIDVSQLRIPDWEEMASRYNITEFNTAIKPFAIQELFNRGYPHVVYIDPDILICARMTELERALLDGAEIVLTPHSIDPIEEGWFSDVKFLQYGVYNLGFIALSNTSRVRGVVAWWARRLQYHCIIKLEEGIFVDQKWVDLFPALLDRVVILRHPGYNVAYWNLPRRKVTKGADGWTVNGEPLRFVHFSGNKLEDPDTFSRHNRDVTLDSVGDLRSLLDEYRALVYSQGHEFYRHLPYAFNWDGAAGVNEHTPRPAWQGEAVAASQSVQPPSLAISRSSFVASITSAREKFGGWLPLLRRGTRALRRYGVRHVSLRVKEHLRLTWMLSNPVDLTRYSAKPKASRPAILFADWSYPRPDHDAGSVMAVALLDIFDELGYEVWVLAANMQYDKAWTPQLEARGFRCIDSRSHNTPAEFFMEYHGYFSLFFFCRGGVAEPLTAVLRKISPEAKIIFDTVDLHYVREMRQAEVTGSKDAREQAERSRNQELTLIKESSATVILSREELYTIREELPDARLLYWPLIFDNTSKPPANNSDRKDILFIGSYPHAPNVDAAIWFAREVFPIVREWLPNVKFLAAGSKPTADVLKLGNLPGVEVLGFVENLEDLFARVRLSVAPLRFGAGIKGKIGSSMTSGVPCVATSIAIEGMGLIPGRDILVGDDPEAFAEAVVRVYGDDALWDALSKRGMRFIAENLSRVAAVERVKPALISLARGFEPMEHSYELRGFEDYLEHELRMRGEYKRREVIELSLLRSEGGAADADGIRSVGRCCLCGSEEGFSVSDVRGARRYEGGGFLQEWSDDLACRGCGFVSRVRGSVHAFMAKVAPDQGSRIYLSGSVTDLYEWFRVRYPNIVAGDILGGERDPSVVREAGFEHDGDTNSTVESGSVDALLSLDSLGQVPDHKKALMEFWRVLAPGGSLVLAVPFHCTKQEHSLFPGRLSKESRYDAETIGEEKDTERMDGFNGPYYFGWRLIDELREVGFVRPLAMAYWSLRQGYLGRELFVFIARKARDSEFQS